MTNHLEPSIEEHNSSLLVGTHPHYRKIGLAAFVILFLLPTFITVPFILSDPENPEGVIEFPKDTEMETDGFLFIILDGVGRNQLLDISQFSGLDRTMRNGAVLEVQTGPLTLSATCISEVMTGVPNSPIDGLKNFDLGHPGGEDPWTLAEDDSRYSVGFIGSYVIGNLYEAHRHIEFVNTFKGHGDFYEGDLETEQELNSWLETGRHNVIAAHFSGPDKVGHKWGVDSQEYREKMLDIDAMLVRVLTSVPSTWTVVVTADHGMTDSGTHGSAEAITREVAAFISGPDILQSSSAEVHQRDLPAFMSSVLGLPFPVQLHGQIPLDILSVTSNERQDLEQWNWAAAVERQEFYAQENSFSDENLDPLVIEWDSIPSDFIFTRNIDHIVAFGSWSGVVVLSLLFAGKTSFKNPQFRRDYAIFIGIISFSLWSHINLNENPMVPRFAGAVLASALVAWPFLSLKNGKVSVESPPKKKRLWSSLSGFTGVRFWVAIFIGLLILIQDFSTSIAYLTIIWFIALAVDIFKPPRDHFPQNRSRTGPILLGFIGMAFASLRLWFCLIPLFLLLLRETHVAVKGKVPKTTIFSLIGLATLTFIALISVHRRIFDRHHLLDFLRFGWPITLNTWVFSLLVLTAASLLTSLIVRKKMELKAYSLPLLWVLIGLIVQSKGSSMLDLAFIGTSLVIFLIVHYVNALQLRTSVVKHINLTLLSGFVVLTWGAWAASVTLILLVALGETIPLFLKQYDSTKSIFVHPRVFMALAMLPWVVWILWWTLLGQVNGLQTCMEGICPHPRELDPGAVLVRGGYIGSRENPSTSWMTMMTVLPLFLISVSIFKEFMSQKIPLYPYIITQTILIFGCLNIYAFSAEYPRLVFSLTWSIFFSLFQILTASLACFLSSRWKKGVVDEIMSIRNSTRDGSAEHSVRVLI